MRCCLTLAALLLAPVLVFAGTIQEDVIRATVEVRDATGIGSGTVIDVGGKLRILTAAHVVKDAWEATPRRTVVVRQEAGGMATEWTCTVVRYSAPERDGGHDLALLKPRDPKGLHAARMKLDRPLTPGEDCWYCGSGGGIARNLEKSIISRTDYETLGHEWTMTQGLGWYGHSGSGLYVLEGHDYVLVGVICRLAWSEGKAPILCQPQVNIRKFLREK